MLRFVSLVSAVVLLPVLATPTVAVERFEASLRPGDFTFSPGAGRASERSVILWSTGAASAYVDTPDVAGSLQFSARAYQCEGAPHLQVAVDGVTRLTQEVDGDGSYGIALSWPAGRHKVTFRFLDDHRTASCDRNVLVRDMSLYLPGRAVSLYSRTSLRPEHASVEPPTAGSVTPVRAALRSNGALRFRLDSLFASDLYVALVGVGFSGRTADVVVTVDDATIYAGPAPQRERRIAVAGSFGDGGHDLALEVTGDPDTATCDGSVAVTGAGFAGLLRP